MPGTNIAYGGTVLRQPAVRCAVLTSRMTVTADDGGRAAGTIPLTFAVLYRVLA